MIKKVNNKNLDNALLVFRSTSKNVEAYKKFLIKNKISAKNILNNGDFESIPVMDKSNYLLAYKPKELVPFSKFPSMISASSGSSGKPYYWPRSEKQEIRGAKIHRVILKDIFKINKKRTLAIICFSMGNWVAGTYTLSSLRKISNDSDFNLSIITPGMDKNDIIQILNNFAVNFESVVIFGYPPFLMDVILEAKESGVDFKKFELYFIFAGENFSEKWRDIIFKHANIPNKLNRSVSIYGTADAGVLGHENPFTILVRKLALENKNFRKELLGDTSFIPTIVSYYPEETYFESINGELVFTTDSGIPLIRYNIKDHGILSSYNYIASLIKKCGLSNFIDKDLMKWKNPIIILKGRNDVLITFYGLNIYPENIKAGLEDSKVLDSVTGKYTVKVDYIKKFCEQKLKISVELKKNILQSDEIKKIITDSIVDNLLKLNTEYRKLFSSIDVRAIPEIILLNNGNDLFIIKKSKHKWVQKDS